MRSRQLWRLGALLLALTASGCGDGDPPPTQTLVLVTFERLPAAETGGGGHPRARTPHLDRLARSGLQAVEARTPAPGARISLASILTGLFPDEHGLEHDDLPLGDAATLASIVRARGYRTAAFAGTGTAGSRHGFGRGFDRHETRLDGTTPRQLGEPWRESGIRPVDSLARALDGWIAEDPTTPAFAWIHLGERGADADGALGDILDAFDLRETLVVATATTGDRVPFIVAGPSVAPGSIRRGRTSVADAAPILASSLAGPEARRTALANPPDDRLVRVSTPALDAGAVSHVEEARAHDRAGRTAAARRAYEDALRAEPRLVEVRMRAAELARRSGEAAIAVRHAEAILARVPEHREARILLSRVLAKANDLRGPAMLEPVLAGAPHHPGALVAAGEVALSRGDPFAAAQHYRHALATTYDDTESLLDVGRGLSRLGLHREAVETVHRALDRGDRVPDARYTLAWVLEQAERFPESVQEYELLIRDHPEYLPPYRNLGALMARDGEVERAIRLWEEGLRHHPDDPGLRTNVEAARGALGEATLGG